MPPVSHVGRSWPVKALLLIVSFMCVLLCARYPVWAGSPPLEETDPLNLDVNESAEAHLRLGIDFFLSDELEVAIHEFREAARQRPGYAHAYHNLGVALAKTGNLSGAIAAWTEAERLDPLVVSTRYRMAALVSFNYGVALLQERRLDDAMRQWEEALRVQPNFVEAHYALGRGRLAEGNPLPAIDHFQQVLYWAPQWAKGFDGLGRAYFETHDFARAREAWLAAKDLKPDDALIYANLGLLAVQEGNYQQAVDLCRQAMELDPSLTAAHFNLGLALYRKGEEAASLTPLETAWKGDPGLVSAPLIMGVVRSRQGQWAAAASLWGNALRHLPDEPERTWLRFNRGLAFRMMGNVQDALVEYRQVTRDRPDWADGWGQLGRTFMELRQWEEAAKAYQKAVSLDSHAGHLYYALGRIRVEQGRLQEAGQAFQTAVEIDPSFVEAHYQLGLVRRAQNKPEEAVEPLRVAAEGGSPQAQALLASMYANGSGVDRNLPMAMVWWFHYGRVVEESGDHALGHPELSRLRRELFGRRLSEVHRQDILTGFALIRQDLMRPESMPDSSLPLRDGQPHWQAINPSERVTDWVVNLALALDNGAQATLARWYEQGMTGDLIPSLDPKVPDYFIHTGKEGNPHSCQVIQRFPDSGSKSRSPSAETWQMVRNTCQAVFPGGSGTYGRGQ